MIWALSLQIDTGGGVLVDLNGQLIISSNVSLLLEDLGVNLPALRGDSAAEAAVFLRDTQARLNAGWDGYQKKHGMATCTTLCQFLSCLASECEQHPKTRIDVC